MLKLKVSLAILNKLLIFAMSNNERPHNLTKTQKDCWKIKFIRVENKQRYLRRVKWRFGIRLNEAIKPKSFDEWQSSNNKKCALNPNVRQNANQLNIDRETLLYEVDGNSQGRAQGVGYELKKAFEALSIDTKGMDRICLSCRNNGIRFKATW